MRESILVARQNIARAVNTIQKMKTFIAAAQEVCEHDWREIPELFDYHKNEEYQQCNICGKIV